jgi:multiple sugar transport system substrate-binding protein
MIKRKIALLLTLVLMITTIFSITTGCDNKKVDSKKVTISYWSIYPQGDPYTAKHQKYIDEFEKANLDIKIQHLGTNFWDYFSKLSTTQAGGSQVDVYWNDIVNVKFRASTGVVADLSSFIQKDKVDLSSWTKADIDSCQYKNGIYALPVESDYRLLFYNKDHFKAAGIEQPPKTLAELKDDTSKLTKITTTNGKQTMTQLGFDPRLGNDGIQQIVWSMGGSFFDVNGKPTINNPTVVRAMQWWVDISRSYNVKLFNQFQTAHSDGSGKDISFIQGATSMVINENGLAWQISKTAPNLNYGVAPVPYDTEQSRTSWAGGFTLEMSKKSTGAKAEAAWKFIKFMTGEDVQSKLLNDLDFTPANLKAMATLESKANANEKIIFSEFKYGRHVDYCAEAPQWWSYLADPMSKAIAGQLSASQATEQSQKALVSAIDEYNKTH